MHLPQLMRPLKPLKGILDKIDVPVEKRMEVLELLLRCPSIDIAHRDMDDKTALDYAKDQKRTDIIKAFEDRKSYKKQGHTCCSNEVRKGLQIAAEDGDLTMVKAFLICPDIHLNNGYEYGRIINDYQDPFFSFNYYSYYNNDDTCQTDYLEIRDGSSQESPLIDYLCGDEIPAPILSTQSNVWMR